MYISYFGFQRPPFELVPDPDFLFLGETHDAALANVAMGLESGKGFVVLTGPVGAGKTTILRSVLRRVAEHRRVCFLTEPETGVHDLLRAVLDGFDVPSRGLELVDMRRALKDLLDETEQPAILIVDEAHLLDEDALEQLRLLSNLEKDFRKLIQIVLSGQLELKELLARPRLRPLAQRIEVFYEIQPLSAQETWHYIHRRLRIAGNPDSLEFDLKAIERIHSLTGGIPRLVNVLADRALVTAYVAETSRIHEKLVLEAFEDLGELARSVMPGATEARRPRPKRSKLPPPPPLPPAPAAAPAPADRPRPGAPEPAAPRAPAAYAPARRSTPRRTDRYLAGGAIAALILLALGSLATGGLDRPGRNAGEGKSSVPSPRADPLTLQPREARRPSGRLAIQVGSFRKADEAHRLATELAEETGEPTRVASANVSTGTWYRVLVGECATAAGAQQLMEELKTSREFATLKTVRLEPLAHAGAPEGS